MAEVLNTGNNENTPTETISAARSPSVSRATFVQRLTTKDLIRQLGPQSLTWLGSLIGVWYNRNNEVTDDKKIPFSEWVVNRDELEGLRTEMTAMGKEKMKHVADQKIHFAKLFRDMTDKLTELTGEVTSLRSMIHKKEESEDDETDVDNQSLKIPKTQESFNAVRSILYRFNKKNHKLGDKARTWGEDGQYSVIKNEESLNAWFESSFAEDLGLGPETIKEFAVCVFQGELVTISKDFVGGVGIEAFWIPDDKYSEVCTRSKVHKDPSVKDPREGYKFNGVRWSPPKALKKVGNKKRKGNSKPSKPSKVSKVSKSSKSSKVSKSSKTVKTS